LGFLSGNWRYGGTRIELYKDCEVKGGSAQNGDLTSFNYLIR